MSVISKSIPKVQPGFQMLDHHRIVVKHVQSLVFTVYAISKHLKYIYNEAYYIRTYLGCKNDDTGQLIRDFVLSPI